MLIDFEFWALMAGIFWVNVLITMVLTIGLREVKGWRWRYCGLAALAWPIAVPVVLVVVVVGLMVLAADVPARKWES